MTFFVDFPSEKYTVISFKNPLVKDFVSFSQRLFNVFNVFNVFNGSVQQKSMASNVAPPIR